MATAGRPTEYTTEILEKAQEYLDSCVDEEYDWTKTDGDKSTSYEHRIRVNLPSIEGLARYLNIARSTLYLWEKEHQEFSDILGDIKAEQAQRLIKNGLSGDYNSTISKLILTKHGYSDKQEITGANGKDLIPQPILGNLNVLPTDDGDSQDSEALETDTGDSGRNISQQDNLDSPIAGSSRSDRPEADPDERSI